MGRREIPRLLGTKLKTIRNYYGLSQEQMCEIVGAINRAQISKYESSKSMPSISILEQYIAYVDYIGFKIHLENLLYDKLDLHPALKIKNTNR